jgi:hypothetical protein
MTAVDQLQGQQQQQQMPPLLVSLPNVSQPSLPPIAATTPPAPSAPTDAPPAPPDVEQPVEQPHGYEWFKENSHACLGINGLRVHREWCIKTIVAKLSVHLGKKQLGQC